MDAAESGRRACGQSAHFSDGSGHGTGRRISVEIKKALERDELEKIIT